jgi:hypothetical protein
MSLSDFLRFPTGAKALVLVMLWPVVWAAVLMIFAFAGDVFPAPGGGRRRHDAQ